MRKPDAVIHQKGLLDSQSVGTRYIDKGAYLLDFKIKGLKGKVRWKVDLSASLSLDIDGSPV